MGITSIPVMVARDRSKRTIDGVLKTGSADELCHCLNGRISMTAAVCADAHLAHEKLARKLGFIFKELVTSSSDAYQRRNFPLAACERLSQYFEGVAGRYFSWCCDKVPTALSGLAQGAECQ